MLGLLAEYIVMYISINANVETHDSQLTMLYKNILLGFTFLVYSFISICQQLSVSQLFVCKNMTCIRHTLIIDYTRKFSPPTGGFILAPAEG